MKAQAGDTLMVPGRRVGDPVRVGRVLEARTPEGPFLVRWDDDQHVGLFYPAAGTLVRQPGEGGEAGT